MSSLISTISELLSIIQILKGCSVTMANAAKNWCFTINNYSGEDVERLEGLGGTVTYLICGKEVGDSGTPHLQGYLQLPTRRRMSAVKDILGNQTAHLEVTKSIARSIQYCKKEGDYFEIGELQGGSGKRNDLDAFKEDVRNGMLSLREIRETHSQVYAQYPRFVLEYLDAHKPEREMEVFPLRPWQQDLNQILNHEPNAREIIFVVDFTGNSGKTWFAHYYDSLHTDKVQVLCPGKKADMVYALDCDIRVLFLDCPRSKQSDFIQYDFLEEVKNGYIFSQKYESRVKKLGKLHVVCLMNEMPDRSKLSEDRYHIIEVTAGNN